MRVLHVIESMSRGGAERNLATLLPALGGMGVESVVATLWAGHAYDDVLARFATRRDFGLRPGPAFSALPGLVSLARTVDIVHTQLPWADIVGRMAAVATGKPSITTVHSTQYDPENIAQHSPSVQVKFGIIQLLDATLARTSRHFFAVSPAVRDSYVANLRLPPDRVEVAPCVLDTAFAVERQPPRAELRAGYGMADGEVAIVTVGRLIPSKRWEDAIAAVAALAGRAPVHLYLVGSGPEEARLRALAGRHGCPATFLGERSDVAQLLHASDLFVFPTLFEGMPMALLEAMAMGKACVCSDLEEIRQLGGESLTYFQPRDVAGLTDALAVVIEDAALRARLETEARAAALHFADPEAAARRFLTAARGLLDRSR